MLHATRYALRTSRGQSLIEVLIAIAIGTIFITGIVGILVLTLRVGFQNKFTQSAAELAGGLTDQIAVFADANWHNVYDAANHDGATPYYLSQSGSFFVLESGTESVSSEAGTFSRWFTISNVYRDSNNAIVTTGGVLDPSTLKITAHSSWTQNGQPAEVSFEKYLARSKNRILLQTDWSLGGDQEGPITLVNNRFASSVQVNYTSSVGSISVAGVPVTTSTGNIVPSKKWAWNDVIGWIDFRDTGTVTVSSSQLTGYASSSVGYFALDCATSPVPNCTYPYKVNNNGVGILSGWAWNDAVGWVSFADIVSSTYQVTIDDNGDFQGWAWNDVIGWISFNCTNAGTCTGPGGVNYSVKTIWRTSFLNGELFSSIFDTQQALGAAANYLLWQGSLPAGTIVKFQIASSQSSTGPWTYVGPDGSTATYYQPAGPNLQVSLNRAFHNNHRYIRYRVYLEANLEGTTSPRIDDIIISWSP